MLHAARNFITWGEISKETLNLLVKERGRLTGNKKLSDEYAQKVGFKSLDELVEAISNCQVEYWKLPNVEPVFKLHPPTKGFKGKIKRGFTMGGELGYRGEKINDLIKLMI